MIYLDGFYGKFGAIIACFIIAVYIVQHSAKIAWDVDTRCTVWPNSPSSQTPLLPNLCLTIAMSDTNLKMQMIQSLEKLL